jgi:hypothetical protein
MLGILRLAHGLGRISWYLLSVLKGELIKKKKKKKKTIFSTQNILPRDFPTTIIYYMVKF